MTADRRIPLLADARPDRVMARHGGTAITVASFLSDVASLAAALPNRARVINMCADRYRFTVALGAALCRAQISLLPPYDTPGILDQIATEHADVYVLFDGRVPDCACPAFAYPDLGVQVRTEPVSFPAMQPACVLFTSGSTGTPQPHQRSWGELVRSATSAGQSLGIGAMPGAALIGTVPHQHSYGLESLVMLALQHDLVLHTERPFYPEDVKASLASAPAPRILVTTPVHLRVLLEATGDLPPTALVLSATAPLSPQLARDAEARFADTLAEIYGCSEAGQLATRRTTEGPAWHLMQGVALRQDGDVMWAQAGDGAEIALGDRIVLRERGEFLLLGRTGDMVEIAGKRTSLAHLAFQLNAIPGIVDGVFAWSDDAAPQLVRRLVAFVVAPGLSAEQILAALRLSVDPVFLPRRIRLVSSLPRNDVGKLTRQTMELLFAHAEDGG